MTLLWQWLEMMWYWTDCFMTMSQHCKNSRWMGHKAWSVVALVKTKQTEGRTVQQKKTISTHHLYIMALTNLQNMKHITATHACTSFAILPLRSGLRFLSTGGGWQSVRIGLRGGVLGLERKPMWAGGGTCFPREENSMVLGVMGT